MFFVLTLAIYKAAMLTVSMMVDWRAFLFLVGLDAFFIALLLLLVLFRGFSSSKLLRSTLWLLLVFLSMTYLVDSFVLLALNQHAPLFDMGRYALEPGVVLSFFDIRAYIAIVLLLFALFTNGLFTPAVKRTLIALLVIALSIAGFCSLYAPLPLTRYAMLSPVNLMRIMKPQPVVTSYSEEQIEFYASHAHDAVEISATKPDIILLVVESLSSINSTKVSGAVGFMDGFDKLAEEGMLFRNFFANHQASEGGMIALLGGYPPIHYPSASPYMFDEFAIQPSVMAEYQRHGYFTEFLTNSDLGFIGLNHFLDGLDIDRSRGRDEVGAMKDAPRIVQDAPSDALLYEEALLTVQRLSSAQQPFLLTMATTSTHLPYTHPENGDDTRQAVWEWSLRQLTGFYQTLTETGFFENGILLITGDHRHMRPLIESETTRYGGSARARIPLLVIGNEYPPGEIDERFFQQSDLLHMLGKINQVDTPLSPQPIWVERYNRKFGRIELIDSLSVFDEADHGRHEYRLRASGNRIMWLEQKPEFARRLETHIHAQRSLHQQMRSNQQ